MYYIILYYKSMKNGNRWWAKPVCELFLKRPCQWHHRRLLHVSKWYCTPRNRKGVAARYESNDFARKMINSARIVTTLLLSSGFINVHARALQRDCFARRNRNNGVFVAEQSEKRTLNEGRRSGTSFVSETTRPIISTKMQTHILATELMTCRKINT